MYSTFITNNKIPMRPRDYSDAGHVTIPGRGCSYNFFSRFLCKGYLHLFAYQTATVCGKKFIKFFNLSYKFKTFVGVAHKQSSGFEFA